MHGECRPGVESGEVGTPLLAVWRIPDERLRRDLARVAVAGGDNRDIVEAVDRDVLVIRDRSGQRPDFLTFVIDDVHLSFLLCDGAQIPKRQLMFLHPVLPPFESQWLR